MDKVCILAKLAEKGLFGGVLNARRTRLDSECVEIRAST